MIPIVLAVNVVLGILARLPGAESLTLQTANPPCFISSMSRLSSSVSSSDNDNNSSSTDAAKDIFSSPGWPTVQKELDTVPIFTVANEQGQPLQYTVDVNDQSFPVPFLYTSVDDALQELTKAKNDTKLSGLDIIPVPLGKAFQLWATNQAVIIPSQQAIQQAGAPPGAHPLGQQVPLFACMEIAQESEETGTPVLPLFLVLDEAHEAVKLATEADGGNTEDLEVVSLSLPKAVQLFVENPETTAFQFVPPRASIDHIQNYLTG